MRTKRQTSKEPFGTPAWLVQRSRFQERHTREEQAAALRGAEALGGSYTLRPREQPAEESKGNRNGREQNK